VAEKSWRRTDSARVHGCRIFDLNRVRFESPEGVEGPWYYVIDAPNWVNVIPLTAADEVLMVRQFRVGIEKETLEIPGGMCDDGEEPAAAAWRELLEETGYRAGTIEEVGWVHPNPPIQSNRCYTYLARDLEYDGGAEPDSDELLELVKVPLADVPRLMDDGTITHALVLAAFQLFEVGRLRRP
jgi:8-oxo-dGTP pyrophosphatase MutT (NUDIX family)